MPKLIKCKTCNAEIAKSAKTCPSCGAKNKKPLYTKWWFYVAILIVVGAMGSSSESTSSTPEQVSGSASAPTTESSPAPAPVETKKEKFEIVGEITHEDDGFGYYINGVIKNNTTKEYSYAQVTFNLFDADGNQIGTAMDNINNLKADGTWKFKAIGLTSDTIASYELAEITGW